METASAYADVIHRSGRSDPNLRMEIRAASGRSSFSAFA
jgi:hypothetical protein